jgi:Transposase and inactivated derivatives
MILVTFIISLLKPFINSIDISDSTLSRITNKITLVIKEWQASSQKVQSGIIHERYSLVRSGGQIVKKAVYIAIGINMDGIKDCQKEMARPPSPA